MAMIEHVHYQGWNSDAQEAADDVLMPSFPAARQRALADHAAYEAAHPTDRPWNDERLYTGWWLKRYWLCRNPHCTLPAQTCPHCGERIDQGTRGPRGAPAQI